MRLADEEGAYDVCSGRRQRLEPVHVVVAGTSCKDASKLNPHHYARLNAVDKGEHSTGSTFQALMAAVRNMQPACQLLVLENVASLRDTDAATGRSNFDGVRDAVAAVGMDFFSRELSAEQLGLPVLRPRLYMAGVRRPRDAPADGGVFRQAVADSVVDDVAACAVRVPLSRCLLPDGEPESVQRAWMPEALAPSSRAAAGSRWRAAHEQAWAELRDCAGLSAEDAAAVRESLGPWLQALTPRQQDVLLLELCSARAAGEPVTAITLQASLDFVRRVRGADPLPTQLPSGRTWLVPQGRLLLGVEALMLQGCEPQLLPACRPGRYRNSFLQDLAGNAFCVHEFVAWFLACLAAGHFGDMRP